MKKILVIEDEQPIRNNLLNLLEAEGFEAISAENGFVGVKKAQEHLPDLIFCDITMPVLDGYGVLSFLRDHSTTATIPFIYLTGKSDLSDLRQTTYLGADGYLIKPFTRTELLHRWLQKIWN